MMLTRCYNLNNPAYPDYGGRGITVCERWRYSFLDFWEDMGTCPPGLTLERRDNNASYTPENSEWATRKRQAQNRRSSVMVTYQGETHCLKAWAEKLGLRYKLLWRTINEHGIAPPLAFTLPQSPYSPRPKKKEEP
jgi:hypothetical protein